MFSRLLISDLEDLFLIQVLLLLSRRVKYLSPLKGDVVLALINEKTHLLNNSFDEAVGVSGKGKVAYGRGLAKIPGIVHASGSYAIRRLVSNLSN